MALQNPFAGIALDSQADKVCLIVEVVVVVKGGVGARLLDQKA